ncbi:MAG: hypothetical protein ACREJX_07185, partial [Polyangiaceae bacterium]
CAALACDKHVVHRGAQSSASTSHDSIDSASLAVESKAAPTCTVDTTFPSPLKVPEASGAAEVELVPGVREMLVVSDSGNEGAAIAIRIPDGPVRSLTLALDNGANDDLEGITWRGGHLFTLTSSGAVRRYTPDGKGGLARDGAAYRIGDPPYSCPNLEKVNCGKNYEGICLRDESSAEVQPRCIGYAASKKEGALYCVVMKDNVLSIDSVRKPLILAVPDDSLSDCAFGAWGGPAQSALIVTTNVHGGSTSYVVNESTGGVKVMDVPGTPSNEAIAIDREGALYQMMDDNGDESLALRMTCSGW